MVSNEVMYLVGCGDAKRSDQSKAGQMYTSSYFACKRNYVEARSDEWYVLSAEYGLVKNSTLIKPYDTVMTEIDTDSWGQLVSQQICQIDPNRIVALAGEKYIEPLSVEVERPLEGMGMFEQMSWLKKNK